ncbi:receptor-interacting serine/threonine-protein kinase 3 [Genypterus blacodes]|uniref:receptor-interacting serine/threonine-protein kinase 3 n=1 Tax=Genypterus blacodes TaxID=154954 RepID=UPI003F776B68
MALTSSPARTMIDDCSLQSYKIIGSGGFGRIYKARHLQWCCDVAIKLLHRDDGSSKSLLREVNMMQQASNPCVIQVLGVYRGKLLSGGSSECLGLVMEFMEKGSLASLQETLRGPPPWALAFRLAHQVALGINFLHTQTPAVLHLDLKPSNVLLDSSLNAKLTDFGLSRFYQSGTRGSKDSHDEGGTFSYMPPEALDSSSPYKPTKASDIYSYGILLWSIVTGKQPYENVPSTLVRVCIPNGDRPLLEDIRGGAADRQPLVELMQRCWLATATQRPCSYECTSETEKLYKLHKPSISHAVHEVLVKLDPKGVTMVPGSLPQATLGIAAARNLTGRPPLQEPERQTTRPLTLVSQDQSSTKFHHRDKTDGLRMKGQPPARPVNACSDHARSSSETKPEAAKAEDKRPRASPAPHLLPPYQRQSSSPGNVQPYPHQSPLSISLTNVVGFQYGNNNYMHVDRRRHLTAPSSVNRSGSFKDKAGRIA